MFLLECNSRFYDLLRHCLTFFSLSLYPTMSLAAALLGSMLLLSTRSSFEHTQCYNKKWNFQKPVISNDWTPAPGSTTSSPLFLLLLLCFIGALSLHRSAESEVRVNARKNYLKFLIFAMRTWRCFHAVAKVLWWSRTVYLMVHYTISIFYIFSSLCCLHTPNCCFHSLNLYQKRERKIYMCNLCTFNIHRVNNEWA